MIWYNRFDDYVNMVFLGEREDKIMLITSGYNFEGHRIINYLGLCSGECALGTGFLSSFGAGLADLLGTNSSMYEGKLNEARKHALDSLMSDAAALGANAIIAVDVDYTVFSADIVGVTANGTAVIIEKELESRGYSPIHLDIKNFNPDLPIKPSSILITSENGKCYAALSIMDISTNNITAIACDIQLSTILDDTYKLNNIAFYDFNTSEKIKTSVAIPISIPIEKRNLLKSAHVTIIKYCDLGEVISPTINDVVWTPESAPVDNQGNNVSFKVQFMINIKTMSSAREIWNYCTEYDDSNNGILPPELLDTIKSCALKERLYGNMYNECIKQIEQFMK